MEQTYEGARDHLIRRRRRTVDKEHDEQRWSQTATRTPIPLGAVPTADAEAPPPDDKGRQLAGPDQ